MKGVIDRILLEEFQAPRSTPHSITGIVERLRAEEDFTGASYSTVRDYVQARRAALARQTDSWHSS